MKKSRATARKAGRDMSHTVLILLRALPAAEVSRFYTPGRSPSIRYLLFVAATTWLTEATGAVAGALALLPWGASCLTVKYRPSRMATAAPA